MILSKVPNSILLLAIVALVQFGTIATNEAGQERKILNQLLNITHYDRDSIPKIFNQTTNQVEPVQVNVSMYVISINEIDENKMQFGMRLYFRQGWLDPRLKYSHINGNISQIYLTEPNRIWRPDTFFPNEINGHFHEIVQPNMFVRIGPSGEVYFSQRLSLTLSCPMNHQYYPFVKHLCFMELESYGYSTRDIIYDWKSSKSGVNLSPTANLPGFAIESIEASKKLEVLSTGNYSRLVMQMVFVSRVNRFITQLYMPSICLIVTSWIAFWLHPSARIERTSLTFTTVLAMIFLLISANAKAPSFTNYITLIDLWNAACCVFVSGAFIESTLVSSTTTNVSEVVDGSKKRFISRIIQCSNWLDAISRILFPVTFIVFCIFYCTLVNVALKI